MSNSQKAKEFYLPEQHRDGAATGSSLQTRKKRSHMGPFLYAAGAVLSERKIKKNPYCFHEVDKSILSAHIFHESHVNSK